jgi:hypothetical protein
VDKVDNVGTDGSLEDSGESNSGSDILTGFGVDVENRSGSGLFILISFNEVMIVLDQ